MGKVFSWEEIREGKIPQNDSFTKVSNFVARQLEGCKGIVAGLRLGTVLNRQYTVRSDLDFLYLYDPNNWQSVQEVSWKIARFAYSYYVPLDAIPVNIKQAGNWAHTIDLSFSHHLKYAVQDGGIIKQNPLSFISLAHMQREEDVRNYLRFKLGKIESGFATLPLLEERLYPYLQKILEAPLHIVRKILWLNNIQIPNDSKVEVLKAAPQILPQESLELLNMLVELDKEYSKELGKQIEKPDYKRYEKIIQKIINHIPILRQFIFQIIELLDKK